MFLYRSLCLILSNTGTELCKYLVPFAVLYLAFYKAPLRRAVPHQPFGAGIIFLILAHPVYEM